MQIQVNSDNHIVVDTGLSESVEEQIRNTLGRFEDQLTRVEVHLSDANSHKPGLRDKKCLLEARPANHQPLTTTDEGPTVEQTVRGAATKMKHQLETFFGRQSAKS